MDRRNFLTFTFSFFTLFGARSSMGEEDVAEKLQPRTAKEVAERCIAVLAISRHLNKQSSEGLIAWLETNNIASYFSQEEKSFFQDKNPTQRQLVKFSWRVEALVPLLWALNHIEKLPPLNEQISELMNLPAIQLAIMDPSQFILSAKLRSHDEIQEAEEFLYHQHWRVRDAQLFKKAMPKELDPDVVFERRYALSWLIGWGEDWDDVPTDT